MDVHGEGGPGLAGSSKDDVAPTGRGKVKCVDFNSADVGFRNSGNSAHIPWSCQLCRNDGTVKSRR